MSPTLSADDVLRVAELAQLELSEGEVEVYKKQLSEVLAYVGLLNEVDTEGVEEMAQVTGLENVVREVDSPGIRTLRAEMAVGQARRRRGDYVMVGAVLSTEEG